MIFLLKKLFGNKGQKFSSHGLTDTGRVRSHNEDNFAILADRGVLLVADGMGGHNAGEVASRLAIEAFDGYLSKKAIGRIRGNCEEIRHILIRGVHYVNDVVMKAASEDITKKGMGCTLVSCLLDGDILHICHVGDSRCYVGDPNGLEQLTIDHSCIAEYEEKNRSGDAAGVKRPPRQMLTRAIGHPFSEDPEYHSRRILPGSRLLLCSDGLWSMVDDNLLYEILMSSDTLENACMAMINKANQAGGPDNITAVAAFCPV